MWWNGRAPISQITDNIYNFGYQPSTVHLRDSYIQRYFAKQLLLKVISVFKWDIPKDWAWNYFMYVLYGFGWISVVETNRFGVIPQQCGLGGVNVFYQPLWAVVANPWLKDAQTQRLEIGTECEIIRLLPDYSGVMDIVNHYADLMTLAYEATECNLINSKLAYVFLAENKNIAESLKKMYDHIQSGNPAVAVSGKLVSKEGSPLWQPFEQNLGANLIAPELMDIMQTIENQFDTEVGLPNVNTTKRERLITDEANANNIETYSKMDMILEELKRSCQRVNQLFGINLSVDWRYRPLTQALPPVGDESSATIPDESASPQEVR